MSPINFRTSALFAALILGAATQPSSLRAQVSAAVNVRDLTPSTTVTTIAPVSVTEPSSAAGPRIAPAGISRPVQANPLGVVEPPDPNAHLGAGSNLAMMGVGAAGIVIGLLIGGDGGTIIALGGGVIGLVGLYRYLR